uniref:copper ion binding protein n=1 Tax=Falsiroseomonas oryziterrae TaxID=2911368 RepID=UPI001F274CC7
MPAMETKPAEMPDASAALPRLSLPVEGMTCASCAGRVERALRKVPGVSEAHVNLAAERVEVDGTAGPAVLAAAIRAAGYAVPEAERSIGIEGMTCASCAGRVERALARVPGVLSVSVNLAAERATLRLLAGVEDAALGAALAGAGYRLTAVPDDAEAEEEAANRRLARQGRELLFAAALTAPFLVGMAGMAFERDWMPGAWTQLALTTAMFGWFGPRFWRAAWGALRDRTGNMDLLVSIGTGAAILLSVWLMWQHDVSHGHGLYFEAAVVVLFFVLLGKWLEARAKRGTGAAIRALLALRPRTARRLDADDTEREVPAA